jgi:hypothetical protein
MSTTEAVILIIMSPVVGLLLVAWARKSVLDDQLAHRTGRRVSAVACGLVGVGIVVGVVSLF